MEANILKQLNQSFDPNDTSLDSSSFHSNERGKVSKRPGVKRCLFRKRAETQGCNALRVL